MTTTATDADIVAAFLEAIAELSLREAGARVAGVSHDDVSRWRRGDWKRLSAKKRRALMEYLGAREGGEAQGGNAQADLFMSVGQALFTKAGLYQNLSDMGGPGEAREKKLYLVQALHAVADRMREEGMMPPMSLFAEAYRDIIDDQV